MTGQEIYKASLALLAESCPTAMRDDYEERYPYILSVLYCDAEELDFSYKTAHGIPQNADKMTEISSIPENHMPLSDIFYSAAVYYLASMLIIDENSEYSDTLFDKYSLRMADIAKSLPSENVKIKNVYF